jgi:hypothetical protein
MAIDILLPAVQEKVFLWHQIAKLLARLPRRSISTSWELPEGTHDHKTEKELVVLVNSLLSINKKSFLGDILLGSSCGSSWDQWYGL